MKEKVMNNRDIMLKTFLKIFGIIRIRNISMAITMNEQYNIFLRNSNFLWSLSVK